MSRNKQEARTGPVAARFETETDALMTAINASVGYDQRMWREDIRGSLAHAEMLKNRRIISEQDFTDIARGLKQIGEEIESGGFAFKIELEDIHMNIESRLKEIIGDAAGRLHTARSRNDQVATDVRLWLRGVTDEVCDLLTAYQKTLLRLAENNIETVAPGFTHLQSAQPVSFAHHLLAYFETAERDKGRFKDLRKRLNECPLGAAALAGTPHPVDRKFTAEALDFDAPTRNSIDSVSARDFALEFMSAAAICGTHLSRLAEEIVIWMTPQFGFVTLSDKWTTGSSIMPQKKNPDAAELIRAKTGRLNGSLITLLTVMKGLPLAYSKDMQEDKEALFDCADTIRIALKAMNGMVADMKTRPEKMRHAAESGFSTATDLADWLVTKAGLPFREAYGVTGKLVTFAEKHNVGLHEIPLAEMREIEPRLTEKVLDVLTVDASVSARKSYGGTAFERVREQIENGKKLCHSETL